MVFVVGHGAYWDGTDEVGPGGMWTLVPTGMTVHFYSQDDQGLLPMNALEILRTNATAGAMSSAGAGERIPNYCFSPLGDDEWMRMLGGVQNGQDVRFIGRDDLAGVDRLCLTSGACTVDEHPCFGLFTKLAGVTDLHLLTCRTGPVAPGTSAAEAALSPDVVSTEHIPGESAEDPVHYNRIAGCAEQILDLVGFDYDSMTSRDPENAEAAALFDGLDEADRVKLMSVQQVQIWSYVRYARLLLKHYRTRSDTAGFLVWLNSQPAHERDWYHADPYIAAALGS